VLAASHKPATPRDFREKLGAGSYAFKSAKDTSDYAAAAQIFSEASLVAPWVPDVYYDMGLAYEAAKDYKNAVKSFNWYLDASPNAADADKITEKIGALKYAASHPSDSPAAAMQNTPATPAPQPITLTCRNSNPGSYEITLDVASRRVAAVHASNEAWGTLNLTPLYTQAWSDEDVRFYVPGGPEGSVETFDLNRISGLMEVANVVHGTKYNDNYSQCTATAPMF
jgi:tetratricopeptide (TPR) repeat protein